MVFTFSFLIINRVNAQTHVVKALGGSGDDRANSIIAVSNGGYIIAGSTTSFESSNMDALLTRFDAGWNYAGATMLDLKANGDRPVQLIQTEDMGFAMAGQTWDYGENHWDFMLSKFDAGFNHQWSRTIAGDNINSYDAYALVQTADGGYALAGTAHTGFGEVFVTRLNVAGYHEWTRAIYGTLSSAWTTTLIQTSDNGFAMAANNSATGGSDVMLIKLDSAGDFQWAKIMEGNDSDYVNAIVETGEGDLVIAGNTNSFDIGLMDMYISRYNNLGAHIWTKIFGGYGADYANCMIHTSDDGFLISGYTTSLGAAAYDILLVKVDASGSHQWSRIIGGADRDIPVDAIQTSDGGYAVVGYTESYGSGSWDMILIKLDADGNCCLGEFTSPLFESVFPDHQYVTPEVDSIIPIINTPTATIAQPEPVIDLVCLGPYMCGDVNGDRNVNILDITYLISYLYKSGPPPDPMEAADVNNDGAVNILDITYLISFPYKEGPDPVCP